MREEGPARPSAGPAPEPGLPKVRTQGGATSGSGGRAEPDGAAGPPAAAIFQEISAGDTGLTLEVGRVRSGRIRAEPAAEIRELPRDDRFSAEAEDRGGVARDWKHFALIGATFSSARRPDKHGRPRALRTATRPEGDGGRDTEADNLVADGCVAVAEQQLEQGRFFNIKSPEGSMVWKLKPLQRLSNHAQAMSLVADQCAYGGPYKKPTRVLTNAAWLLEATKGRRCNEAPAHSHTALVGRVYSYRTGTEAWFTRGAAEYPSGLCEAWAGAWADWLG